MSLAFAISPLTLATGCHHQNWRTEPNDADARVAARVDADGLGAALDRRRLAAAAERLEADGGGCIAADEQQLEALGALLAPGDVG